MLADEVQRSTSGNGADKTTDESANPWNLGVTSMNRVVRTIQLLSSTRVLRVNHRHRRHSLAAMVLLLAALRSFAQDPVPTQNPLDQAKPAGPPTVVLPAGTRIPLALQRAISTKTSKPGDMAYLLTTAPVIVGDSAVIPPDTFVQGQIARITVPGIDRDGVLQIHFDLEQDPKRPVDLLPQLARVP